MSVVRTAISTLCSKPTWERRKVVGGVGCAKFLSEMVGIATCGRSFSPFGVNALNRSGAGEDSGALVADDVDQKPGNGIGIWGRRTCGSLAIDPTGIAGHPGRPSKMFAEEIAVDVKEIGVRGFQHPGELGAIGLAGVDLVTLGMNCEEELLSGGRLKLWGNLLGGS